MHQAGHALSHRYILTNADETVLGELGLSNGRLVTMSPLADAMALAETLNAHKQRLLWRSVSWDAFLQAYELSDANEEAPLQLRVQWTGRKKRLSRAAFYTQLRIPEFQRRLRLIDMLAGAGTPLHRRMIHAQMLSEVLFKDVEDVLGELKQRDADELPPVPGLSGPTLSSDVADMRRLGLGFAPDSVAKKKQAFEVDVARLPLWVGDREAEALKVAVDVMRELNLPAGEALEGLYARVSADVRDRVPDVAVDHVLANTNATIDAVAFKELRDAIRQKKPMRVRYQSANATAPKTYYLEHARLVWMDGSLYVLAHCPQENGGNAVLKNREFRVDRFRSQDGAAIVKVLDGPTSTPELPSFEVVFRAEPDFAPRFQDISGAVRVGLPDADGSRIVKVREHVPLRAARRMLSYGQRAQLLGPDYILALYQETLSAMVAASTR